MSFARFMELALYCPVYGFYEKEKDTIGRRGDFITSVSVGPLFGELLATQFADWLEELRQADDALPQIVEAGAHNGRLAKDVLTWLREHRPELYRAMQYSIVEPSAERQRWQRKSLAEFGDRVRWSTQLAEVTGNPKSAPRQTKVSGIGGIVFSNELLDAFPVHRLGWEATGRCWFEWGVTLEKGRWVWTRIPLSDSRLEPSGVPPELLAVLPDGFTTEVCPAAQVWWRTAAEQLQCGRLLTIDYGLSAEDFFGPRRSRGTLRSYFRHRGSGDVLANPGEQDITVHVNFTALKTAGEDVGLKTEAFATQAEFLTQIARRVWGQPERFGKWTSSRTRQFQTLTHPEHLGRPFHVLVQSRNLCAAIARLKGGERESS